jgi:hypothetical protein
VQVDKRTSGLLVTTATVTLASGDTDPDLTNNSATDTTLVNGRFIPDVGYSLFATGSGAGAPADVRVYDAPTGQLLYQFMPFGAAFLGGVRVATGDVNGDGREDIVVGAGPGSAPHIKVYDGRDLSELASFYAFDPAFQGGVFVAAAQLTPLPPNAPYSSPEYRRQIPFDNVVVGAGPGADPHVMVFRVDSGSAVPDTPLASFLAFDAGFRGGVRVAASKREGQFGDDLITAAGPGGPPHVKAFNRDGAMIASFLAYNPAFTGGVYVAGSTNQIITGAGVGGQAHVKTFSIITAGEMQIGETRSFLAFAGGFNGEVRVAAADRNGDLHDDLILAAGPGAGPQVTVLSGVGLTPLDSFFAYNPLFSGGVFVG